MRICFVRLSALGDVVMCLPLLRTLQKSFPHAEITWVIGKPFHPLVEKIPGVHFIPTPKDWREWRKLLKPYTFDVLLATQASFSAHLLYASISAKRRIGYDSVRSKDFHRFFINERIPFVKEHTVEGLIRFATTIGAKEVSFDGSIPVDQESPIIAPYCVINPCSSKKAKDWNYKNYIPVIQFVRKKFGLEVVLTGGAVDRAVCDEIAKEVTCHNLCGKTTLQGLAAVLKGAKFVLSPDTGPAHIASHLGVPVIGLFAPTSSLLTGPYFSRKYVIDKHAEVLERYRPKKNWNVRVYEEDAMSLITVAEVEQKIREIMVSAQRLG